MLEARLLNEALDGERALLTRRPILREMADALTAFQRAEAAVELGAIAKLAHLRFVLDLSTEPDPLRLVRGATRAHRAVSDGATDVAAVESASDETARRSRSIALWAIGLLMDDRSMRDAYAKEPIRTFRRAQAREVGWASGIGRRKLGDVRRLLKSRDGRWPAIPRLIELMADRLDLVSAVINRSESSSGLDCAPVVRMIHAHTLDDLGWVWADVRGLDHTCIELLTEVLAHAPDRGDVLRSSAGVLVVEPQGFADALVAAATRLASDQQNAEWHERCVEAEVRKMWSRCEKVQANVSWISPRPPDLGSAPHKVTGEIDVLILGSEVVVDIQAKSARSVDPSVREALVATGALAQHRKLTTLADGTFWILRDGEHTVRDDRVDRVELKDRALIAITVGTDVVQRWSVGGASSEGNGEPARVLTTLDHLRLVNEYLPPRLREIYWVDRHAQEHDPMRFIDEVDYLGKWHTWATGEARGLEFRMVNGYMLATDSEVERDLVLRNTWDLLGTPPPAISRMMVEARGPLARMRAQLDRIDQWLGRLDRMDRNYFLAARALVGNRSSDISEALERRAPTILKNGPAPVGMQQKSPSAADVTMYRRASVPIVLARDGRNLRIHKVDLADGWSHRHARFDSKKFRPEAANDKTV